VLGSEKKLSQRGQSQITREEPYFEVVSILGKKIRTTVSYWEKVVTNKHPRMRGREKEVQEVLREATEVRRSKMDPSVYLYYKGKEDYFICAVVKHINSEGFLITTYLTEAIKEGKVVWKG